MDLLLDAASNLNIVRKQVVSFSPLFNFMKIVKTAPPVSSISPSRDEKCVLFEFSNTETSQY